MKEFTYLRYRLQKKGGQEVHVRERAKKAAAVLRQVWGIKKRESLKGNGEKNLAVR